MVGGFEIKQGSATGYVMYLSNGTCCDHERDTLTKGVVYQPYLLQSSVLAPAVMADRRWLAGIGLDPAELMGVDQWLRIIDGQSTAGTQLVSRPTAGQPEDSQRTVMTDFVVSLPKSISLEYFHLRQIGKHQTADALLTAFQRSIATGLSDLQDEVKMFRVGSGSLGTRTACKGSLGAITFLHETARPVAGSAENPHIHAHVVVPNMGLNEFGQWTAVNFYALRKHYLGFFNTLVMQEMRQWFDANGYQTEGRQFHETRKPCAQFDLSHRDVVLEEQFSLRGRTIKETIEKREAQKRSDLLAKLQAKARTAGEPEPALLTPAQSKRCQLRKDEIERIAQEKQAKGHESFEDKRQTVGELLRLADYKTAYRQSYSPDANPESIVDRCLQHALGSDGLTLDATFFNDADLASYVSVEAVRWNLTPGEMRSLLHGIRAQVVALPTSEQRELGLFTTRAKIHEEAFTDLWIRRLFARNAPAISERSLDEALAENVATQDFMLSTEQEVACRRILGLDGRGARAADLLIGEAGSGKTATLRVVAKAMESEGFTCIGISTSNVAKQLLVDADITSFNASHFIEALRNRGDGIERGTLNLPDQDGHVSVNERACLILDECSLTSSSQFSQIMQIARRQGVAKILFVGDPAQLPVVGNHGSFFSRIVAQHHGEAALLTENRRQGDESFEALCSRLLKNGRTTDYLMTKMAAGQLLLGRNDNDLATQAAELFEDQARRHGGQEHVLLMSDLHRDRIAFNQAFDSAQPPAQAVDAGPQTYTIGARVQFSANYKLAIPRRDERGQPLTWGNGMPAMRQHLLAANKEMGTVTGFTTIPERKRWRRIEHDALTVHIDGKNGRDLTIRLDDARECLLPTTGITVHSSQGQSPQSSIHLLSHNQMVGIEGSYVSQSRGKKENFIGLSCTWEDIEHTPEETIQHYAVLMARSHVRPTTLDYLSDPDLEAAYAHARSIYMSNDTHSSDRARSDLRNLERSPSRLADTRLRH